MPTLAEQPSSTPLSPDVHRFGVARGVDARGPTTGALTTEPLNFSAAPMLLAACSFAAGILATRFFWHPPFLLLLMLVAAAALTAIASRFALRTATLAMGCVWVLLGMICAGLETSPDSQMALVAYSGRAPHRLEGRITRVSPVRMVETIEPFSTKVSEEFSEQVDVGISRIQALPEPIISHRRGRNVARDPGVGDAMTAISGGLRVSIYAPRRELLPALGCGTPVLFTAAVHEPDRFLDPGVWDSRAYMLSEGIGVVGAVKADEVSVAYGGADGFERLSRKAMFLCRLHAIQQGASERLLEFAAGLAAWRGARLPALLSLTGDDAAMLSAMIAGDRTWLNRRIRVGFERTGSFHLLVVSGMHLAIFAGLIFWMAGRLRLSRVVATVVTIVLAFAYALCTGFGQPVQRSFWMVSLFLVGRLLWRERSALNAIGFAALCLLAVNPRALFDAGFQMTLLSVVAIAGIAAPVAELTFAPWLRAVKSLQQIALDATLPPGLAQLRVSLRMIADHLRPLVGARLARSLVPLSLRIGLRAAELLLVSATIELIMCLPMAVYFHRVTVLALPVNFLIVPLIGLLLPAALLTFVALLFSKALAVVPAAVTALLLHIIVGFISHFSSLRFGDLRIASPASWAITASLFLLAFAIWVVRRGRRSQRRGLAAAGLALVASAALVINPRPVQHRAGALEVLAIDVGQGDSILVIGPDGKTLLIDAGGSPFGPPPGASNFDIGEDVVSPVLWSRGIRRLDAMALTHAHADHIGGMAAVFANFRPREFWIGRNPHSALYDAVMAQAALLGTEVHSHAAGDKFTFGVTQVEVLAPEIDYRPGPTPTNDDSLVLRLVYGRTSALMEGDAEAPSERNMVADGRGLHSNLLKVGHHGSRTSTQPAFFAAVAPSFAVVSVGRRNFYGHPRREVLQLLQDAGVKTFRTDTVGAEDFFLDGKNVIAASANSP